MSNLTHLVTPFSINAESVKGCCEVNLSGGEIQNPSWKKGDLDDTKFLSPREYTELMVKDGWKVITIAFKRSDGPTNYGHEPTMNYELVAVLVKTS